jgi:hypothetical protein
MTGSFSAVRRLQGGRDEARLRPGAGAIHPTIAVLGPRDLLLTRQIKALHAQS